MFHQNGLSRFLTIVTILITTISSGQNFCLFSNGEITSFVYYVINVNVSPFYPLFRYSNGVIPVYRLKYLLKKEILGKFSESEICCIESFESFSWDFASIITMYEMKSVHVFPVTCFTIVHKYTWVTPNFSAYQVTLLFCV